MPTELLKQYWAPRYWHTWFGLAVLRLLAFLPLPVLATTGHVVGYLVYLLHFSRRRIALINIQACFPELSVAEQRRINRTHFGYMGQSLMTACMNWWISPARFERLVTISGREHYDAALAKGEKIILLSPHFVAMEVCGLALQRERPMVGMYQYMKNPVMNQMALRGRQRFCPDGVMFERKAPLRTLLKILMKGLPMVYSPDQDAMRKGVFVPFFHPLASTTPALAKFIQVTKSVVIPLRGRMLPWGQGYEVVLGAPVENLATGDEHQDTAAMNRAIEAMVRDCPEQYLWVHKRFKTRPPGEPSFY
ncbi:MAG: lysophospholipid acyltransferase family protein [Gammaproteobacteria bacterium]|nr:lysophospholipid acyltransferase family protein [Gammaproteobacteria bacterium]